MATNPPLDLDLSPLDGTPRPLREWLTTFHLGSVVLDPYTNESSWVLNSAERILEAFRGADVRVNFVLTSDAQAARQFMGPLVERFLIFTDPDRHLVKGLGLTSLPAFVFLRADGEVAAATEGWDAAAWREVAGVIAQTTAWQPPTIPAPGDPGSFAGSPAVTA